MHQALQLPARLTGDWHLCTETVCNYVLTFQSYGNNYIAHLLFRILNYNKQACNRMSLRVKYRICTRKLSLHTFSGRFFFSTNPVCNWGSDKNLIGGVMKFTLLWFQENPSYSFSYGVADTKTGDIKTVWEAKDGDTVKGKEHMLFDLNRFRWFIYKTSP